MFKMKPSDNWYYEMARFEDELEREGVLVDFTAGRPPTMEKLGIAKADLLNELKEEYRFLKEREASLIKTGGTVPYEIVEILESTKARIDELEAEDGGRAS